MMKNAIMTLSILIFTVTFSNAKELYRAPSAGYQGSYYIIESKKLNDGIIQVLSSRIGKGNAYTDFTELKVNCKLKQYFEVAGSEEDGAKDKPTEQLQDRSDQSKWTSLVTGSSKYDLVEYICKKNR